MKLFYFLLSTVFICLNANAQLNPKVLSSDQVAKLRALGVQAIQEVISDSDIDLSDSDEIKQYVSEILQTQISEETTPDAISDITNVITSSILAIAARDTTIDLPTVVEATASEATKTTINTVANLDSDINGDGVVDERDIQEMANAAASGASSGALSVSSEANLDISEIVEAVASGSVSGTVEAAVEENLNVADMVETTSSGSTSGIIEVSTSLANDINGDGVVDEKDIITAIDASSAGAISGAIESVNLAGDINNDGVVNELDVVSVLESTASGISAGAVQSTIEISGDINFDGVVDERDVATISETVAASVTDNIVTAVVENSEAISDGESVISLDAQTVLEDSANAVTESIIEVLVDDPDTSVEELSDIAISIVDILTDIAEDNILSADALSNIVEEVTENVESSVTEDVEVVEDIVTEDDAGEDEVTEDDAGEEVSGDEIPIVETPDDTLYDPSKFLLEP